MKTAKTIAKLYSRTELTAALCDAVANWQASEQARHDVEAALADVRARLRDLRDQWMDQQKAVDNGDIVVTDHIYEDCAEDVSPLLVDPLTRQIIKENGTSPQAEDKS